MKANPNWRTLWSILLVIVMGLCGSARAATTTQDIGGQDKEAFLGGKDILRFGLHVSKMGRLDPHFAAGSQDRALADMVFNGLLRYVPGQAPKLEPDLATHLPEFEMEGGRQVWTLKLRRGVMFHRGPGLNAHEMTADDVVFSLHKAADPASSAYAGEYSGMEFSKVDTYEIKITLTKPLSPTLFLPKLANYGGGFIISKKAVETIGYGGFKAHPIGTGPFRFVAHEPGLQLRLEAHEDYFRGKPQLKGVSLTFLPDTPSREAAFRQGATDLIMASGDEGWIDNMAKVPNVAIDVHGVGEVSTLYFNLRMKPMDDIRVRKAIAHAIDRDAFLAITDPRLAGYVYSPVPAQFLAGGLRREETEQLGLVYKIDLAKAKKLLNDAGYADGFVLDLVTSEKRIYRRAYTMLRRQLAQIGIDCRIKVVSHSEMHKQIRQSPQALVIYVAWRPNADAYLSRFFHSDSIVVSGTKPDTNFAHYDKIDKLIEDARLEILPEKQVNLWKQAQIRILSDMAALPLMFTKQCYVRRTNLHYGHPLFSTMALYPQFTENTRFVNRN